MHKSAGIGVGHRGRGPLRPDPRALAVTATLAVTAILVATTFLSCSFPPSERERKAAALVAAMSDEDKVSQLFMIPVSGSSAISGAEARYLARAKPGAIILFGFNVSGGADSTRALTASIQDALALAPLPALVAIDQEGGAVFRFKGSLTRLPSAAEQGAALDAKGIENLARLSGAQLRALGITANLAPVVEPLRPWNSGFLKDRAYSPDPALSADRASAFARGMARSGVAATLKHFPGNAAADPHEALPVLDPGRKEFERDAIRPFRRAIAAGRPGMVMLSHVVAPALDPDRPVSLSPAAVLALRRDLGFKGVVLTDDLEMAALAADRPARESALLALEAGDDMLMLTSQAHYFEARQAVLDALASGRIGRKGLEGSVRRITALKLSLGLESERDPGARARAFGSLPGLLEECAKFVNDRFR